MLPILGFDAINLDRGAAVLAQESEAGEGKAIALFGGEDIEALCFNIVGLDAEAKLVAEGEDALGLEVAQAGG